MEQTQRSIPSSKVYLTWDEFDNAVEHLASMLSGIEATGVYGPPRGGLPLAVALSHRLSLPYLHNPQDDMIWVDDIVETGKTLSMVTRRCAACACWAVKSEEHRVLHAQMFNKDQWLVFPWEPADQSDNDMKDYHARR